MAFRQYIMRFVFILTIDAGLPVVRMPTGQRASSPDEDAAHGSRSAPPLTQIT
jgi:hypothetical protein